MSSPEGASVIYLGGSVLLVVPSIIDVRHAKEGLPDNWTVIAPLTKLTGTVFDTILVSRTAMSGLRSDVRDAVIANLYTRLTPGPLNRLIMV